MAKAFSVASWNVEHFKGDPARVGRVVSFLQQQNPDVFALYEVEGKEVFTQMVSSFQNYTIQVTEGQQSQEILVGVRNSLTAFITQRTEFKSGTTHMRPGQLVNISVDGTNYQLLFLHLASKTEPRGFGLRDSMLARAVKFRHTLDKAIGGTHVANYIFLGDLNIMGMDYPYGKDIDSDIELTRWSNRASQYYAMHRLGKTFDKTYKAGAGSSLEGDLDHVFAAKHLVFRNYQDQNGNNVGIDVRGWVNKTTESQKNTWISRYSDHSLLYFEVQKV